MMAQVKQKFGELYLCCIDISIYIFVNKLTCSKILGHQAEALERDYRSPLTMFSEKKYSLPINV